MGHVRPNRNHIRREKWQNLLVHRRRNNMTEATTPTLKPTPLHICTNKYQNLLQAEEYVRFHQQICHCFARVPVRMAKSTWNETGHTAAVILQENISELFSWKGEFYLPFGREYLRWIQACLWTTWMSRRETCRNRACDVLVTGPSSSTNDHPPQLAVSTSSNIQYCRVSTLASDPQDG